MFKPVLITPPANTPIVSLAEAKAFCREDTDEHDATITSLILAAQQYLDGYGGVLGRALLQQIWEVRYQYWEYCMRLPLVPLIAVTEINYIDQSGATVILNASNYYTLEDPIGPYVVWKPDSLRPALGNQRRDRVGVKFSCGYADASQVPERIKLIINQLVVHWHEGRSPVVLGKTVAQLPLHIKQLITSVRRVGLT